MNMRIKCNVCKDRVATKKRKVPRLCMTPLVAGCLWIATSVAAALGQATTETQSSGGQGAAGSRIAASTSSKTTTVYSFTPDVAPQLPSGWQSLPFDDFVDMTTAFYKAHGRCAHCEPLRNQIAANAWERFLGDDKKLAELASSNPAKLILLVSRIDDAVTPEQRQQLCGSLKVLLVDNQLILQSMEMNDVILLDETLRRLASPSNPGPSSLVVWLHGKHADRLSILSPGEIVKLWHQLALNHSVQTQEARNILAASAWTHFLADQSYLANGDALSLADLANTAGRDLSDDKKAFVLSGLINRFGHSPQALANSTTWGILHLKWAYRGVAANDVQVMELLRNWALQGRDWDTELNPTAATSDAYYQVAPSNSSSAANSRSSIDSLSAHDFVGYQLLVGGMKDPLGFESSLTKELVKNGPINAVAAKLLAHASSVAKTLDHLQASLEAEAKAELDPTKRASLRLALAYSKLVALGTPNSALSQRDVQDAMSCTTDPSTRFACVEWIAMRSFEAGNTTDAEQFVARNARISPGDLSRRYSWLEAQLVRMP